MDNEPPSLDKSFLTPKTSPETVLAERSLPTITLSPDGFSKGLTEAGKQTIQSLLQVNIILKAGGTNKQEWHSQDTSSPLVVLTHRGEVGDSQQPSESYQRYVKQIEFYNRYKDNSAFKDLVVQPLTVIETSSNQPVGQIFPQLIPLNEYLKDHTIKYTQIEDLYDRYKKFISETGIVHGDLARKDQEGKIVFDLQHLFIHPTTRKIMLIDYNGQEGNPDYAQQIAHDEIKIFKTALDNWLSHYPVDYTKDIKNQFGRTQLTFPGRK